MEKIIKQVIESEYRAQKIIDEIEKERKQIELNTECEIEKIREKIFLAARQKAEEIKANKLRAAEMHSREILSEAHKRANLMQSKFKENKRSWIKLLINDILNLDK